jgi:hypothetical protein
LKIKGKYDEVIQRENMKEKKKLKNAGGRKY